MKKLALIIAFLAAAPGAHAVDRFVTDQFKITMRSGQSSSNKVLRMLPSGYPLRLIGNDKATGYSEVQTKDGKRGYVLTRYLDAIPSARNRITEIENKLKELQSEPERLAAKLGTLQDTHKKLVSAQKKTHYGKTGH